MNRKEKKIQKNNHAEKLSIFYCYDSPGRAQLQEKAVCELINVSDPKHSLLVLYN